MKQKENHEAAPVLLTTAEAAKAWNVSRKSIYRWVREGRIKPLVAGLKGWRFRPGDVESVLERL